MDDAPFMNISMDITLPIQARQVVGSPDRVIEILIRAGPDPVP
jgi:hypothetical protein